MQSANDEITIEGIAIHVQREIDNSRDLRVTIYLKKKIVTVIFSINRHFSRDFIHVLNIFYYNLFYLVSHFFNCLTHIKTIIYDTKASLRMIYIIILKE